MRRIRWIGLFLLLAVLLAGCGPGEPPIEKPAAEMNLTAADVGADFYLDEEEGFDQITADMEPEVVREATDANMRLFSAETELALIMGIVVNMKDVSTAKKNMRGLVEGFETGLTEAIADVSYEELSAPEMGDDAVLSRAVLKDPAFGEEEMYVYMLGVRKANVLLMVATFGPEALSNEATVRDLVQKMLAKTE